MHIYEFANTNLPELSSFRLRTPESWRLISVDDALMTVVYAGDDVGFRPNVVVTAQRFSNRPSLSDLVDEAERELRAKRPELAVAGTTSATIDNEQSEIASMVFHAPPAGPFVFQIQALLFAPAADGSEFLLQVHGTCAAEDAERWAPTLVEIIKSLRFSRNERSAELLATAAH